MTVTLAFGVFFSDTVVTETPVVFAATLQELSKQKTELQKQIEQKQKEAAEKKKAADAEKKRQAQLDAAVNKIENDISSTESKIGNTEKLITDVGSAIDMLREEIQIKEQDIAKKRDELFETVGEYYIVALDSGNELNAILTSARLSQAIDQNANFSSLADKLIIDGENLDKEKQSLIGKRAEMEEKQQSLKNQKDQLAAYQNALDGQKQQKEVLIGKSKEAQDQYLAQASEAAKVSEQLKKQFATVSNEEAAMRRAASKRSVATASRNGATSALGFTWPVDGRITTNFGGSTPFQGFHTGLDIAGPAGDAVVATHSGAVSVATKMCCSDYSSTVDKSYGYGNWIEIKHDNGYLSRYGHMQQMIVSPGQRVERGQVIGYRGGALGMAGAGWSTGAHLHFEIWDAQGPFDPLIVLP